MRGPAHPDVRVLWMALPTGSVLRSRWRQLRALRRDEGVLHMVRRAATHLAKAVVDSGEVVWFHKYTDPAKRPGVDRTIELHAATTDAEHAMLDAFRPLVPEVREAREAAGGERWYAFLDGTGDIAYTCWTYSAHAIVHESPLVTLPMPDGVYQYEDAYTPSGIRSRHLGRRTTDALCRELESRGITGMITKIDVNNEIAQKGAVAGAWHQIARVHGTIWLRRWTRWRVSDVDPMFPELNRLVR